MRPLRHIAPLALVLLATPSLAAQEKPLHDRDPDVEDVAKTPITDLNIDRQQIPDILILAQQDPYSLHGLRHCRQLVEQVRKLDYFLGPDMDLPQEARDRISAGRVAKTVVGSFIPFRGLIREVSGANDHDRKVRTAIQAGLTRRGFLKGVGQTKGCEYPARPASPEVIRAYIERLKAEEKAEKTSGSEVAVDAKATGNPSNPIVQKSN